MRYNVSITASFKIEQFLIEANMLLLDVEHTRIRIDNYLSFNYQAQW